jgi:hypothetical protein
MTGMQMLRANLKPVILAGFPPSKITVFIGPDVERSLISEGYDFFNYSGSFVCYSGQIPIYRMKKNGVASVITNEAVLSVNREHTQ